MVLKVGGVEAKLKRLSSRYRRHGHDGLQLLSFSAVIDKTMAKECQEMEGVSEK